MEEFYGREKELALLQRIYDRERSKTCVVYGRRQVGKSSLIRRFVSDKDSLVVEFDRTTAAMNNRLLMDAVGKLTGRNFHDCTLRDAMEALENLCRVRKMVIVMDEFPYLAKDNPMAVSEVQHLVDHLKRETESMVIICGSSISMMLDQIRDYDSPIYGRFTFELELEPFRLEEARMFHPSMPDRDSLSLYLTIGGIAAYNAAIGDTSYEDAVNRYILSRQSYIASDVIVNFSAEVGSRAPEAQAVLRSIASGDNTYGAIKKATGLTDTPFQDCLNRLTAIGLIRKNDSMLRTRKSKIYTIDDYAASFCYHVVNRYTSSMADDMAYKALRTVISTHLGRMFERYCRDLIARSYPCTEAGSWWGEIGSIDEYGNYTNEETDVDVIAILRNGNDRITLFGECKYSGAPMGFSALNKLTGKAEALRGDRSVRLALFCPAGFEEELVEYAETEGVLLFDLDVLVGKKPVPKVFRCVRPDMRDIRCILDSRILLAVSTTSAEEYFPPDCLITEPMTLLMALSFLA